MAERSTHSIVSIPDEVIKHLQPDEGVELFRELLWCEAGHLGVPIGRIHISKELTLADGGIDASVEHEALNDPTAVLCLGGTHYQIKTGSGSKPWQKSWVRKELFGSARAEVKSDNLGDSVKRCLEAGERYVVVCFSMPCLPKYIRSAKDHIVSCFKQCGYKEPNVEVWGCDHIVGFLSRYPSLCLKVNKRNTYSFLTHESWGQSEEMLLPIHLGQEQKSLIGSIRDYLRGDDIRHIRLIGEPGVGKTRLVLEATRDDDLAPFVVYIEHAEDFQKSQLYNEVMHAENNYRMILVIDECLSRERASIWNSLKRRSDRCRLVTIDHGPEDSEDAMMVVVECPMLSEDAVGGIIEEYIGSKTEAVHWAPFCGGSPRVAHAIGQNLQRNPEDILKPPATVDIWGKFIAGYDRVNNEQTQDRMVILRHVALFERFGFEEPVDDEGTFIAKLVEAVDPRITQARFRSIVYELKKRRILQGKSTLFIAPKALHIYLWLEFWKHYAGTFSLSKFLPKLPETLSGWFMGMFAYAHLSENAVKQVEKLLGPEGAFSDESFLESGPGCKYLNILAEAHSEATLACIESTIGHWSYERLLAFEQGRQHVVWALEKIAVWPEFFQRAAAVMLKLAEAENASNGNNASGTFAGLFSLAYGRMAPSEATPEQRMPAIKAALESDSAKKRELGLEACKVALGTGRRSKIVGPEYQGLRPVAKLWTPKIYGDLFDAYRRFWDLLLGMHEKWKGEERTKAGNALIDSAGELLWIKSLSDMVLDVLVKLADDSTTDLARLVDFITQRLRYGRDELDSGVVAKLECLDAKITGDTFNSRLRRFVLLGNWDDLLDEKKGDDAKPENVIAGLAKEARDDPSCLFAIIDTLVKGNGRYVSRFGYELGIADSEKTLLERILDEYLKLIESGTPLLLTGYLCSVYNTDSSAWEEIVLDLLSKPEFRSVIVELIWRSGLTSRVLKELIVSCEKGELQAHELTSLNYSTGIRKMGDEDVISLVEFFIGRGNTTCAWAGLELLNSHYCREVVKQRLPRELTFRTLTSKDLFKGSRQANKDYYWDNVATEFIGQYSSEEMKLLRFLFDAIGNSDWRFYSGRSPMSKTITKCIQSDPDGAWDLLMPIIDDVHSIRACSISLWLLPSSFGEDTSGPITLFSRDAILKWVSKSPKDRMLFAAKIAPKTISSDGIYGLAREILDRYGANKDVRSVLWTHFWCGGWCGSQAKYYRKKRDTAREWLEIETSTHVVSWIQEYISILNRFIKESEIEEERRF